MITRFAPTPSGYLHIGNAVNALLVSWLARAQSGEIALRIDDLDAARLRAEYVQDIFATLDWLGIDWHMGPTDPSDWARGSSSDRRARYWAALESARADGLDVYACRCSRSQLSGVPRGGCPRGCRADDADFVPGEAALRVHVPLGTVVEIDGLPIAVDEAMGDFVVWRRDDLPAYHLASVVDDRDLGTTHVVRGMDLRESTAAQLFLAPFLDATAFASATFIHHGLVTDTDGRKLSKSQLGAGGPLDRTTAVAARVRGIAEALGEPVGITPA